MPPTPTLPDIYMESFFYTMSFLKLERQHNIDNMQLSLQYYKTDKLLQNQYANSIPHTDLWYYRIMMVYIAYLINIYWRKPIHKRNDYHKERSVSFTESFGHQLIQLTLSR